MALGNTVIGKRFAKKQRMQWTPRGAHLLLQTRTRALDGTLRAMFERWYRASPTTTRPIPGVLPWPDRPRISDALVALVAIVTGWAR